MKAVIQRVLDATLSVDGNIISQIGKGLVVYFCVEKGDDQAFCKKFAQKLSKLRIFSDEQGKMNLSVKDVGGEVLAVSQFTLMASTKKGNRPSYIKASRPEHAIPLYELFCSRLSQAIGNPVGTGVFGADMQVALINDGPVTICIDSHNRE